MRARAAAVRQRDGWTRLSQRGASKTIQHWRHDASGWEVLHCGHMTALWPYYLRHHEQWPGCAVVSFNGLGFRALVVALELVERIVAGELEVTAERCGSRTARLPTTTADGLPIAAEAA